MMCNQKVRDTIVGGILRKCIKIHEERDIQYGPSEDNFTEIAYVTTRLSLSGKTFTALDIAVCMIATKEARYKYALNHPEMENQNKVVYDCLIDWINYIAIMENVRALTSKDA
ncbi:hypothetical protein LCGC14_1416890 [marine sediment metagenome]|uniref:DUF6378 domain-containing protein n=1 Tax=marine sediment metagenome TaxID=412755 RepID=A0A0F9JT04_9ZZZZ